MKSCNKCNQIKCLTEFTRCGNSYHPTCKSCRNKAKRDLKITNPNKVKAINQKEAEKRRLLRLNSPFYRLKQSLYRKQHQRAKCKDPLFKLKRTLRSRLYGALLSKGYIHNNKFSIYIGCSIEELKAYIESKFSSGMTWENHGLWHIDHIIPLSSAKTQDEMYELCHYTNLQPLWAKDNIVKGNTLP